ncbi:hypothetical protein CEXT_332501 [Caerostris extrusa]|uniref:Uncharacterized protein n=1 Tax=Caerostris extrusa TaxID=172846 RepID=A0AAV4QXY4_CAEEX|nr:hypothetical protein CEXT_332501 [Caerostris extrusa]
MFRKTYSGPLFLSKEETFLFLRKKSLPFLQNNRIQISSEEEEKKRKGMALGRLKARWENFILHLSCHNEQTFRGPKRNIQQDNGVEIDGEKRKTDGHVSSLPSSIHQKEKEGPGFHFLFMYYSFRCVCLKIYSNSAHSV